MKCIRCNSIMDADAPRELHAEYRDKPVSFILNAPGCPTCGHVAVLGKTMKAYTRALADAYRKSEDLMTVAEMEQARKQLGLSRQQFADYVYVGIAAYKRWLRGDVQSRAYDKLVRLRIDLDCIKQSANELVERMIGATTQIESTATIHGGPKTGRREGGSYDVFDEPIGTSAAAGLAA